MIVKNKSVWLRKPYYNYLETLFDIIQTNLLLQLKFPMVHLEFIWQYISRTHGFFDVGVT